MIEDFYCTQCGENIGRVPLCPLCGYRSEYWDVERSVIGASELRPPGHLPQLTPPAQEGGSWVAAAASLSLSGVLGSFSSGLESVATPPDSGVARLEENLLAKLMGASGESDSSSGIETPTSSLDQCSTTDLNKSEGITRTVVGYLVRLTPPRKGETHALYEGDNTLGRASRHDVVVPDPTISSPHARILCRRTDSAVSFLVTDLGSKNGTYVDGRPVSLAELKDGQLLRLADVEFRLTRDKQAADAGAPRAREAEELSEAPEASEDPEPPKPPEPACE